MQPLAVIAGILLIFVILWDAFETVVLPRRVTQQLRLARLFYRATWLPWSAVALRMRNDRRRENFLSFYGPMSLILLLAVWASGMIFGFGFLHWALDSIPQEGGGDFVTALYFSGTSFFTLGLGDLAPGGGWGRLLTVVEAGIGFAFLGLIVGYLPALNQAFSEREAGVSLLDARAGSPPTATELLRRNCRGDNIAAVGRFLRDWEQWSAEVLESHLSYPVLGYFRSHHDHQSWVTALTMILDASALVVISKDEEAIHQAQLTFAIARHAVVDLSGVFGTPPKPLARDRLEAKDLALLRSTLLTAGFIIRDDPVAEQRLSQMRQAYEPYVNALSRYLLMPLPPWFPVAGIPDDWQLGG
ncbi:MAG TPA: potassium channel family protein [Chloroflexia bacterium]|jgi:hypothetical protein